MSWLKIYQWIVSLSVGELPHNLLINCLKKCVHSICTQSVFVQLQKCLFSVNGGGGGQVYKWDLLFDWLLLFLKNALLSLLFHSKMSFTRKNPEFFPRSLHMLGFNKLTNDFFQGARCKTSIF